MDILDIISKAWAWLVILDKVKFILGSPFNSLILQLDQSGM